MQYASYEHDAVHAVGKGKKLRRRSNNRNSRNSRKDLVVLPK